MFEGRKVLWVAGGRDFDHYKVIDDAVGEYISEQWVLVTGAARGADLTAEEVWKDNQLPYVGVPAQWAKHGRRAGYLRNNQIGSMLPDKLLAFPGGKGTENALNVARYEGIPYEQWLERS